MKVCYLLVVVEASVTSVTVGTLLDWHRLNELNRIYNIIQTVSRFALASSFPRASSLWLGVTFIQDSCWPDISGWGNKHTSDNVSDQPIWPACVQDVSSFVYISVNMKLNQHLPTDPFRSNKILSRINNVPPLKLYNLPPTSNSKEHNILTYITLFTSGISIHFGHLLCWV